MSFHEPLYSFTGPDQEIFVLIDKPKLQLGAIVTSPWRTPSLRGVVAKSPSSSKSGFFEGEQTKASSEPPCFSLIVCTVTVSIPQINVGHLARFTMPRYTKTAAISPSALGTASSRVGIWGTIECVY